MDQRAEAGVGGQRLGRFGKVKETAKHGFCVAGRHVATRGQQEAEAGSGGLFDRIEESAKSGLTLDQELQTGLASLLRKGIEGLGLRAFVFGTLGPEGGGTGLLKN